MHLHLCLVADRILSQSLATFGLETSWNHSDLPRTGRFYELSKWRKLGALSATTITIIIFLLLLLFCLVFGSYPRLLRTVWTSISFYRFDRWRNMYSFFFQRLTSCYSTFWGLLCWSWQVPLSSELWALSFATICHERHPGCAAQITIVKLPKPECLWWIVRLGGTILLCYKYIRGVFYLQGRPSTSQGNSGRQSYCYYSLFRTALWGSALRTNNMCFRSCQNECSILGSKATWWKKLLSKRETKWKWKWKTTPVLPMFPYSVQQFQYQTIKAQTNPNPMNSLRRWRW